MLLQFNALLVFFFKQNFIFLLNFCDIIIVLHLLEL